MMLPKLGNLAAYWQVIKPDLRLAWGFALRESRGGIASMRLMLLAMALGVGLITAIGLTRDALFAGIEADARLLLGGDVAFSRPYRPITDDELSWMRERGAVSQVAEMRSMANSEAMRQTIELKAVDRLYPLVGSPTLQPAIPLADALKRQKDRFGAVVDGDLLRRMKLQVGDSITVGDAQLIITAELKRETDRVVNTYLLGPRVLVSDEALSASRLLQPGSLVTWRYRIALKDSAGADRFVTANREAFPESAWRVQQLKDAAPGLSDLLDKLQRYIALIGLAVLVTGGMGMANATTAWLMRRQATIATFKTLGTPTRVVWLAYAMQLMLAVMAASGLGMVVGSVVPPLLLPMLQETLPFAPRWSLNPSLFLAVMGFSLAVAACFAFAPFCRAMELRPAQILRARRISPEGKLAMSPKRWAAYGVMLFLMAGFASSVVGSFGTTLLFASALGVGVLALMGCAKAMVWLAGRLAHRGGLGWRRSLGNLARPYAATHSIVLSLGMGASLLVAVMLMEDNMQRQLGGDMPKDAPSFFVLDIPKDQWGEFQSLTGAISGIQAVQGYPSLRGRISHIKDVESSKADLKPEALWAVKGDRMLSFADEAPPESPVKEGVWWPAGYQGTPMVSITEDLARGFGVKVGDSISVEVMGETITASIGSIRAVNWRNFRMNFALIFSPNTLQHYPYSMMATLATDGETADTAFLAAMGSAIPSSAVVRLKETLEDAARLVGGLSAMVEAIALVALAMGLVVMATAVAVTQAERVFEHTVLKVLGATRYRIIAMLAAEFAVTGMVAIAAAWVLGSAAAWVMMTEVMRSPFQLSFGVLGVTGFSAVLAAVVIGLGISWKQLSTRPMMLLRND